MTEKEKTHMRINWRLKINLKPWKEGFEIKKHETEEKEGKRVLERKVVKEEATTY